MIETQLSILDAAVIAVMLLSSLFAFFRGFVREVLSLGAWIGAGLVTIYYFPQVSEALRPHFKSPIGAVGISTLGIYTIALLCFSLVNMLILKFVKSGSDVGMLDNTLGLFFGLFRGAVIIALGFFIYTIAVPEREYPEWLTTSRTYPYVEKSAAMLASVAPEYLREISTLQKKIKEDEPVDLHSEDGMDYDRINATPKAEAENKLNEELDTPQSELPLTEEPVKIWREEGQE